jgi:predicted phosphodiesterase
MRMAVLADIHGNAVALAAVMRDLVRMAPDLVVNLGDCLSGPLWPAETADMLIDAGWLTVRGNHDRYLLEQTRAQMAPSDAVAAAQMSPQHFGWLATLPAVACPIDTVLAVHGTPTNDRMYLLEEIDGSHGRLASAQQITEKLGATPAQLVLCGHSHIPRLVRVGAGPGRVIVNPGSVGLPAYTDTAPPHVMQTGSPHARYALLDARADGTGWDISLRAIDYDWEAAADMAMHYDRPDWAHALRTGFAFTQ